MEYEEVIEIDEDVRKDLDSMSLEGLKELIDEDRHNPYTVWTLEELDYIHYLIFQYEKKSICDNDKPSQFEHDPVNSPSHYCNKGIETIDVIDSIFSVDMFEGYCIGNVIKYISRYRHKNGLEDLKKARWYLNKIISTMEENEDAKE